MRFLDIRRIFDFQSIVSRFHASLAVIWVGKGNVYCASVLEKCQPEYGMMGKLQGMELEKGHSGTASSPYRIPIILFLR